MLLPAKCRLVSAGERTIASQTLVNQNVKEPFFAVYDKAFLDVLGSSPNITLVVEKDWPFAHEAGVYIPKQDAVYINSNYFSPGQETERTIKTSKVSRQADGSWQSDVIQSGILMGNGGVNYRGGVLFCAQGDQSSPAGLVLMDLESPYTTRTLIDSYHGRSFNSPNDIVVARDGSVWFTDPIYGHEKGFRGKPQLPCQVYRFEPESGDIRVVADGFGRPNGLCFSPDEKTMYVTDTDWIHGDGTTDPQRSSTIYAYDVIDRHGASFLANRRVFAFADHGIPDGIKCDSEGNVYSGCGDGINVWSPGGRLIGKIMIPGGVANFCFTRKGELVALNETRFWQVNIDVRRQGALLASMGIGS